jgi:hypothetical protein
MPPGTVLSGCAAEPELPVNRRARDSESRRCTASAMDGQRHNEDPGPLGAPGSWKQGDHNPVACPAPRLHRRPCASGSLPRRRGPCPAGPPVRGQAPCSSRPPGCAGQWRMRPCGRSGSPRARHRGRDPALTTTPPHPPSPNSSAPGSSDDAARGCRRPARLSPSREPRGVTRRCHRPLSVNQRRSAEIIRSGSHLRKRGDSNPRYLSVRPLSRRVQSAALPRFHRPG